MKKSGSFQPNICQNSAGKLEISFYLNQKQDRLAKKSKNLLSVERKQVSRKIFLNFSLKRKYRSQQE